MKASFYYNKSDDKKVDKELNFIVDLDIVLKTPSSIKNPIIDLQIPFNDIITTDLVIDDDSDIMVDSLGGEISINVKSSVLDFNYCYIEALKRYYFINNVILVTDNIFRLELALDVLMSFKEQFMSLDAYIIRSASNYDELIVDEMCSFTCEKAVDEEIYYPTNYMTVKELHSYNNTVCMAYLTEDTLKYSNGLPQGEANETVSGYNVGNNLTTQYMLGPMSAFNSLLKDVYDNDTLLNFIKTINIYPFELNNNEIGVDSDKTVIKIGDENVTLYDTFRYPLYTPYKLIIADFIFKEYGTQFYHYEPYNEYYLWIPYHKYIKVNLSDIYMQEVMIYYIVNFDTGESTVYVYNVEKNYVIYQASCELGVKVGLTASNNTELTNQKISLGISTALGTVSSIIATSAGIVTGNPIAMASGVLSGAKTIGNAVTGFNSMYQSASVQNNTGFEGLCNYQKVHIKVVKSFNTSYDPEGKFVSTHGRPLYRMRKLNNPNLKGFTQIGSIILDDIKAYDDEKVELESLLKQGIIL